MLNSSLLRLAAVIALICVPPSSSQTQPCTDAGFSGCCSPTSNETCSQEAEGGCFCDQACFAADNCCSDVHEVGCFPETSFGFSRFLYTYNTNGSDNSFDDIDDDDEFVGRLSAPYIMYGKSYQDVYVGSNGQVSFGSGTSDCCSRTFPTLPPLITAFWNDINPNTGGVIYHRLITSGSELEDLGDLVVATARDNCLLVFQPTSAAVVTFERVSAFSGNETIHNTFQVILLTDGRTSYSVFLYNSMNWGVDDFDGSIIGFNDGTNFYTQAGGEGVLEFSLDVLNLPSSSNVGVSGVFVYRTDSRIQDGLQCQDMCYSDVTSCQGASPVLTETAIACCNNNGGATSSYRLNDRPGFCISCGDYSSVVGFEQQIYTVVEGNSVDVCVSFLDGRLTNVTLNVTVAIDQSTATPGIDYRLFQRTSSSPGDSPGDGPIGIDPPPFEPVPPTEPTGNSPVPPPSGQRNEALPRGVVLGDELVILTLNESCRRQCFSVEANRDTLEEMETVIFSLTVSPDSPAVPEGRLPAFIDTRGSTVVIEDFCDAGQVLCMGEEKCILRDYVCDGIPDCTATISTFASDETNCAAICVDGDSRLIGGATSAEGLLETCFNGVYQPVNAEEFTVLEASTVCRQLGIATGGFPRLSGLDFSDLAVQITLRLDVSCGGGENSLADCNISSSVNLAFGEGGPPVSRRLAAVSCITDAVSCSNGDVRLVGGSPREGRLEICYEGVWGSVSDGSWGFLDASVVCQQLGFPGIGALPVFPSTYPGTPSPPILESPDCSTGNESSLIDCPASGSSLGSIPRSASISIVGVKCDDYAPVSCSDLEVRLTHRDRTGTNGQIQICDASVNATGVWSTACSCFVDRTDADVICRQLGCLNFQSQYFDNPVVSAGSGPIFERSLPCRGLEESLDECFVERIRRITNEVNCTHQNDVSVNCAGLPVLFFLPPSPDDCYTVEVGRQFQVDCSVFGEVHPSHSLLSSGGRSTSLSSIQVFSTDAIQPGDAGQYSCTASSIAGNTTRNITIKVLAPAEGQEPNSTAYLQFSVLSSVPQNGGDDSERPPLPPPPPPPFETAEVEPPSQSSQLLNIISVDYPGVQTIGCSEVLPRAIELARGLDRFECMISQFATSQDQPPIISARQIATGVALVLSRIVPAFLITVEDFADLDTQLEMLVNNVTAENFEAVVSELSSIANRTATEMEEQTDDNLGRIAVAFNSVAGLVANGSLETIESNTIRNLVETLNSILQWDPRVLAANGSNIAEDFELIAAAFANQSVGIVFTTPDIAFVAENRPLVNLQVNGRSFSSFDDNGEPDPDTSDGLDVPATLAPLQTAFINLPPSIFNFTDNRTNIGVFFALYDNPSLFPVAEAEVESTTRVITVLSPVVAATATVGPGLTVEDVVPSVTILLRLQQLGGSEIMSFGSEMCVSWNFEANGGEGDWTTDGCETISLVDGVVTCQCSHLTNFAILVEICSRINSRDCVVDLDPELEMLVNNVTVENYEAVVSELMSIAEQSEVAEEEQTEANLGRIATAYNSVASLIANNSALAIVDDTIMGLVETLNSILQWEPEVLAANGSNIVEDFELIAAAFADRGEGIVFTTPDIAFVAENQDTNVLQNNGRSFSTSNNDSAPDPDTGDAMTLDTLAPNQTAFINLPASLFDSVPEDRTNVGVFFALYDNPSLFPVAEAEVENSTRVITVLSPVIAATVGPGLSFMNLDPPISILLRLQELGENDTMSFGSERCVSWVFEANGGEGDWTTEGCETIGVEDGVVTCQCNHLTNFAILVDICSRFDDADCTAPPALTKALEVLTIIGVSLSLFGLVMTIITLLVFKKLRERDATKYHVQLCIAMICMLLVFITGINRTAVYGGCVLVSVLIHYFTLVAVLWMTAEALLMFQKLVIVFTRITTKFIILVSILCWTIPIIPVIIPLIVDLTTRPEQDIVVNRDQFCFLNHPGAFFGAFLGPIFALLIFNVIIFIWVIVVLVRHTKGSMERQQQGMKKETAIRLVISISGIMFLFGLTWLFGALTITVTAVNLLFQILFVVFNSLQGFFIFLFFCVFSKEARESWKEVLSCGRYKSEFLHPSQAKITSSSNTVNRNKKLRTASTGLDTTSSAAKSYDDTTLSKNTLDNEYSDIPMVSVSEPSELTKQDLAAEDTGPSIAQIISAPDSEKDTNVDSSHDISTHNGDEATKGGESLKPLKARVKRFSTKKARKHHVETMEVDFDDGDSDDSDLEL